MSLITRTYTFTDGTTAYGSQVESEIGNVVNTLNSLDAGSSTWSYLKATTLIQAPNGAVGAPSINLGDATTGFYRSASNIVSVALAGVLAASFFNTGTADDTVYLPLQISGGGGAGVNNAGFTKYTASVTTIAKQIGRGNNDGALALVIGKDGSGNNFLDLILVGDNNVTPTVITSKTLAGSPQVRTYSAASGQILLAMAANTYTISYLGMGVNFR